MNQGELESWSLRALQTLQDFCDEAQEAVGVPDGDDQLPDVRALMLEYERIAQGLPSWQAQCMAHDDDEDLCLDLSAGATG